MPIASEQRVRTERDGSAYLEHAHGRNGPGIAITPTSVSDRFGSKTLTAGAAGGDSQHREGPHRDLLRCHHGHAGASAQRPPLRGSESDRETGLGPMQKRHGVSLPATSRRHIPPNVCTQLRCCSK
jgi:hypothetical protein